MTAQRSFRVSYVDRYKCAGIKQQCVCKRAVSNIGRKLEIGIKKSYEEF